MCFKFSCFSAEKMVVQLSKKRSDAFFAFAQLGPSRISTNIATGEEECKIFFPEDYDLVEEETVQLVSKKPIKKKGKKKPAKEQDDGVPEETISGEGQPEAVVEEGEGGVEVAGGEGVEEEGAEGGEEEGGEGEEEVNEADKATSPMAEEATAEGGEETGNV